MRHELVYAEIVAMPSQPDYNKFISSMLNSQFILHHDLRNSRTVLITEEMNALNRIKDSVTGMRFEYTAANENRLKNPVRLVVYNEMREPKSREPLPQCLADLYTMFSGTDSNIFICFSPSNQSHLDRVIKKTEQMLSGKETRLSRNIGGSPGSSGSMQMEMYHESHERRLLLSMLESFNESMVENGLAYKVSIVVENPTPDLIKYLKSRISVIDELRANSSDVERLYGEMGSAEAIPLSYRHSANLISFSNKIRCSEIIETRYDESSGEILLGEYLEGGVSGNERQILVSPSSFNLGSIVTGLPGTGKTTVAMSLVSQLLNEKKPGAVVVSPTAEWNGFGIEKGMQVIRIYENGTPINFFKCDSSINIERFYENLAVLLAAASGAGPYRNSMEKCLLSAFHKVYSGTRTPDPTDLYYEIEKAVIEQHGKRTNTEVTFTKHGENVMASLQHLRLMLMKAQFAYSQGVDFSKLIRKGVVFDLSNVSSGIKPFFYALILNQVYAFCESLDLLGDNDLRLAICLEEAQLVFANNEHSAATIDLMQKIQDFRKRGVGLILITHSVTDIHVGIRRLCQTKMYFRQSSDVVRYACSDLSFSITYEDAVIDRLKRLEQGTCALTYVITKVNSKNLSESVIAKMQAYRVEAEYVADHSKASPSAITTRLTLTNSLGEALRKTRVEVVYVGEKVHEGVTDDRGVIELPNLLHGKKYKLRILGEKKRDARICHIIASPEVLVRI
jgi:hypothetical protein